MKAPFPFEKIHQGDALDVMRTMPDCSVHCCVTSPPYWGLRDYGVDGQLGLEKTPEEYVARMVEVFHEVRRVLRNDGTLWLNMGDSYSAGTRNFNSFRRDRAHVCVPGIQSGCGLPPKNLVGIPWKVAFALQADGWYLRQDIIWNKPNPMPESVRDRCTKAHEYVFLLTKSERYWYDAEAIAQPYAKTTIDRSDGSSVTTSNPDRPVHFKRTLSTRRTCNRRSVWTIATAPFKEAHFATFPPKLVEPCILAGCPLGGTVLDPFFGAGTVGVVAKQLGRDWIGIELNPEYYELATRQIKSTVVQESLL